MKALIKFCKDNKVRLSATAGLALTWLGATGALSPDTLKLLATALSIWTVGSGGAIAKETIKAKRAAKNAEVS